MGWIGLGLEAKMATRVWIIILLLLFALGNTACARQSMAHHAVAVQADQGTGGSGGGY